MRKSIGLVRGVLAGAAVALLGIPAPEARSATMVVNSWTLGEQVNVRSATRNGWVNTAELDVVYDGQGGYSYCVDLGQSIGAGTSTGWETLAAQSSDRIVRAAWLVESFRPTFDSLLAPGTDARAMGATSKTTLIAALQVAVWEVMGDAPGAYDLYSGGFRLAGASTGVMNLARSFLGELSMQEELGFGTTATWAYSRTFQDQIIVNPIPEPSSLVLFAAGAGLIGLLAKRKNA